MKIVIDARMINESGVGRYVRNLLNQLQKKDQDDEYFILLLKKEYSILEFPNNFKKVLADFRWYSLTEQIRLPKILNNLKPDLVHLPHFNVPIFYRGKFIVTIHDLIHQHFQMRRATTRDPLTYKIKQIGYNQVFKNAIKKSIKILVPSNYVKSLLVKKWKIDQEKIDVTYEAVDDKIVNLSQKIKESESQKVLSKFGIRPPFIFYVGNAHPHKNVEGLIKGFEKLREKNQYLQLVLSGNDHYFWQRIKSSVISNQISDIIFTGFINDDELVALYKNAKCFVMPSFEEGFGIPLLEAMAVGCPVVSSNAGSLKEVGDDAALYFDPLDTSDMVSKITELLNSEKLRKELIEKGKRRAKEFSWERLAKQTLEVYSKCV